MTVKYRAGRRALIAIAVLGTLTYLGASAALDAGGVMQALRQLGVLGCTAVLTLSLANYLLRFGRWRYLLLRLGSRLPGIPHLVCYLSGFAFTVSPAKAGEAFRAIYLRDHGVPYAQSISAFLSERLLDLLAMTLLACLALLESPTYRPLIGGSLLLVGGSILVFSRPSLPGILARLSARVDQARILSLFERAGKLLSASRALLQLRVIIPGTAIGVLSWACQGLGYYFICRSLHVGVSPVAATGIYAIALLAGNAAFFLPSGIGGTELVMTTLLVAHGAPVRVALVAALLCRVSTLWFAVITGLLAVMIVELRPSPVIRAAS